MKKYFVCLMITILSCISVCAEILIPEPDCYYFVTTKDYKTDIYKNDSVFCHLPVQEYDINKLEICDNYVYYLKDKKTVLKYYNQDEAVIALHSDDNVNIHTICVVPGKIIFSAYDKKFDNGYSASFSNSICIYDEKSKETKTIIHVDESDSYFVVRNLICNENYVVFNMIDSGDKLYVYDIKKDSLNIFNSSAQYIYGFSGAAVLFETSTDKNIQKLDLNTGDVTDFNIPKIEKNGRVYIRDGRYVFYPLEIHKILNKVKSPITALFFDAYNREYQICCLDLENGKIIKTQTVFWSNRKKLIAIK